MKYKPRKEAEKRHRIKVGVACFKGGGGGVEVHLRMRPLLNNAHNGHI